MATTFFLTLANSPTLIQVRPDFSASREARLDFPTPGVPLTKMFGAPRDILFSLLSGRVAEQVLDRRKGWIYSFMNEEIYRKAGGATYSDPDGTFVF